MDGDTITFNVDVTLTDDLPAIQTNVTILGNNKILDGGGTKLGVLRREVHRHSRHAGGRHRGHQDPDSEPRARGGAWTDNAGGGAGLGGALFVANLATVTVSNLQLDTNSARGGLGGVDGIFGGGGGGGLGGFGGLGTGWWRWCWRWCWSRRFRRRRRPRRGRLCRDHPRLCIRRQRRGLRARFWRQHGGGGGGSGDTDAAAGARCCRRHHLQRRRRQRRLRWWRGRCRQHQ